MSNHKTSIEGESHGRVTGNSVPTLIQREQRRRKRNIVMKLLLLLHAAVDWKKGPLGRHGSVIARGTCK